MMDKGNTQHTYGHQRWSDNDQQEINHLLAKKLSKDTTASRVGAGNCNFQNFQFIVAFFNLKLLLARFTYVESWRAIQLANAIFGFNGWSCSVVDISPDFVCFFICSFSSFY